MLNHIDASTSLTAKITAEIKAEITAEITAEIFKAEITAESNILVEKYFNGLSTCAEDSTLKSLKNISTA